jgi:hypothetical protein
MPVFDLFLQAGAADNRLSGLSLFETELPREQRQGDGCVTVPACRRPYARAEWLDGKTIGD